MADTDLYTLSFYINNAGNETRCVLGYLQEGGSNDADTLEALCQAFIDDALPSLLAAMAEDSTVSRIRVDTVTNHQEVPGLIDLNGQDGGQIDSTLPATMNALIHIPTNAPNSKHNGRIYLAGQPTSAQEEGTLKAAQVTLLQTFADKLALDLEPTAPQDATFTPVVISRVVNGAPRVPPVGFNVLIPVAKASMRQQRRRKTEHFGLR